MARPTGHTLSKTAWDDILTIKGTSLTRVAQESGVPRPTLSALRGHHSKASVPTAHKIAASLGVHAETLFPSLIIADAAVA